MAAIIDFTVRRTIREDNNLAEDSDPRAIRQFHLSN